MPQELQQKPVILITGSEGLIGGKAANLLADRYRLVGLDVEEQPANGKLDRYVRCDLTRDDSVAKALDQVRSEFGAQIASVIHLAAYYDFSGEPSPLYEELTVRGTERLLRQLQTFQVDQFVFSSTLLVMKPSEDGQPLTETSPTQAEWDYPQSKLRTEEVIQAERGKIPAVILRLAGAYDEDGHSVPIANQIQRIYEKQLESFTFPGDTSTGQAFIHLDDVASCVAAVVDRRNDLGGYEVFLVAEPEVMSYDELQDAIGENLHGKEWPTIRIPKAVAKAGAWALEKVGDQESFIKPWMIDLADHHYPVSIAKIRDRLGWQPEHRLRETLPVMLDRLKRDPESWYKTNDLETPDEWPEADGHSANGRTKGAAR